MDITKLNILVDYINGEIIDLPSGMLFMGNIFDLLFGSGLLSMEYYTKYINEYDSEYSTLEDDVAEEVERLYYLPVKRKYFKKPKSAGFPRVCEISIKHKRKFYSYKAQFKTLLILSILIRPETKIGNIPNIKYKHKIIFNVNYWEDSLFGLIDQLANRNYILVLDHYQCFFKCNFDTRIMNLALRINKIKPIGKCKCYKLKWEVHNLLHKYLINGDLENIINLHEYCTLFIPTEVEEIENALAIKKTV